MLAILMFCLLCCKTEGQTRINGASLVNPPQPIVSSQMTEVRNINANWVAVIPYAFAQEGQPKIGFNYERQWWGEKPAGTSVLIDLAHQNDMQVMLKPHVWVRGQGWTGDFDLATEEEWKSWEEDYARYILYYAELADSLAVEMICIGTEYRIPAQERPEFWRSLIVDVREVYSGKVTYAANWDNYEKIGWWDDLDFIGIDAYFPFLEATEPDVNQIEIAYQPVSKRMANFAEKWDKKILFTEYGFLSVNGTTGRHWELSKDLSQLNVTLQADAYDGLFRALESADWYAGGFFWKWHFGDDRKDNLQTQWTPQNKPALETIKRWYSTE